MTKSVGLAALALMFAGEMMAYAGEPPKIIDLWPGRVPGEKSDPTDDTIIPPKPDENPPTLRLTNVTRPQITVYRPSAESNTGVAMLICPGGGFNHLAYDKEGLEIAEWLTTIGVTGVVLKYRCPTKQNPDTQHVKPLQDAQRAMRLIRVFPSDWGVDPESIGICGLSAGGKVATLAATNWDRNSSDQLSSTIEETSAKPAFVVLLYPALAKEVKSGLGVDGIRITEQTPPMFIAYSWDDKHPSPGALHLAIALRQANVSCELHQYASGGHGYGLRPNGHLATTWPARLEDWLRSTGIITK